MSNISPLCTGHSYSVDVIEGNDDLLTEILTRLPVKSLLRFKSVKKRWYSLISNPSFCLRHTLCHPHPLPYAVLIVLVPNLNVNFFKFDKDFKRDYGLVFAPLFPSRLPPPPDIPFSHFVQSTNGLILSRSCSNYDREVVVSNPTTRQATTVLLGNECGQGDVFGLSLAFDPSRWEQHYYILVVSEISARFYIDLYSSATQMWKPASVCLDDVYFDTDFYGGVYWRGRVFWPSYPDKGENLLYYDFSSGTVENLGLPKITDHTLYPQTFTRFAYFGESCGHLHFIEIQSMVREFNVFELEETNGQNLEWFVKYKVDLDVVGRGFENEMFMDVLDPLWDPLGDLLGRESEYKRRYSLTILAVIRGNDDDNDDGCALIVSTSQKVIYYDLKHKISRLVSNDDDKKAFRYRMLGNAFQFIPSLYRL